MDTMKKFAIWILILIGFFIFSNFLIHVGINSTYKDLQREDNNTQIVIYQADATYVNGRIRGLIKNREEVQGKYLKVELYSDRNVLVGKNFIEIKTEEEAQAFELLFKATDVVSYKVDIVKEKEAGNELEILPREWTKPEVLFATAMMFLIFW